MGGSTRALLWGVTLLLVSCGAPEADDSQDSPDPALPTTTLDPGGTAPDGRVEPVGAIERVDVLVPGFVTVSGWVDLPGQDAPPAVTAWLDGRPMGTVHATEDWAAAAGAWPGRGLAFDLPVTDGPHTVCITVAPDDAAPLDCIEVDGTPDQDSPAVGPVVLTAVTPAPDGSVTVRGVTTGGNGPAHLEVVTATGTVMGSDTVTAASGGDGRSGSMAVTQRSFRFRIEGLATGPHAICPGPRRIDVRPRALVPAAADGCGTAVIGDLHVGTTGLALGATAVAPPADHPLVMMERDAGVSVRLRDGSTMWFFGDTSMRRRDGELGFFVHNTVAWASADDPRITLDAVTSVSDPVLFAAAPRGMCAGSRFSDPALWPESAVAIPRADGTDRVVVVMAKVCMGRAWLDIDPVGYAIAEVVYDPRDPPAGRPIRGVVTQPDLAPVEAGFGRAMFSHPDGHVYGYHCGAYPTAWGPCRVARVSTNEITDVAAWRGWNGGPWRDPSSWEAPATSAVAMVVPGTDARMLPVAAFGVVDVPRLDAYLMVYTPWPGFCGQVAVRVAATPVGPWSAPLMITLPACGSGEGDPPEVCYAATPQMQLCDDEGFAGGYFDSMTNLGVARYLTFVTPFVVTRPAG